MPAGVNALDELRSDHEKLKSLYRQWEAEPEESPRESELVREILGELKIHSRLEEEFFYPECRRVWIFDNEALDDAYDDHLKMDERIDEFFAKAPNVTAAEFQKLMDDMLNHFNEEEGGIFPLFDDIVSTEESVNLGDRIRTRKGVLRSAPRPKRRAA